MTQALDWNPIRAFVATAETGSFSKAAARLGTTQPTLSRQVAALEATLECVLFERIGTGVLLTAAGEQLLQPAQQMGQAYNLFALVAAGQSQNLHGQVCVSVSEIDALFRMPAIIRHLHEIEPGIRIKLIASNEASDLKQREADIAVRSFRPTEADLITKKLGDEKIWFFGTREYVKQCQQQPTEHRFKRLQVVGFDPSQRMLEILKRCGWPLDDDNLTVISHSHASQWQLVKAGLGVALFPEAIGQQDPELAILYPDLGAPMTLPLWIVSHSELHSNPRVRRVFDVLAQHFLL